MIACLVIVFFGVVVGMTGPAGREWLARRRERLDAPIARAVYLPSAVCRSDEFSGRCLVSTCAVCVAGGR